MQIFLLVSFFYSLLIHARDYSSFEQQILHNHGNLMGAIQNIHLISYSQVKIHPSLKNLYKRDNEHPTEQDSFILELEADDKTFCLHLHPNYELLHPDAKYIRSTGRLYKREEREPLFAKAFKGFVVEVIDHKALDSDVQTLTYECDWRTSEPQHENYADALGWARLILKDEEFEPSLRKRDLGNMIPEEMKPVPVYEGVFTYLGDIYNIKSISIYEKTRNPLDAPVVPTEESKNAKLLVYKASDMKIIQPIQPRLHPNLTDSQRGMSFCGSDDLFFNRGPAHDYYQQKLEYSQTKLMNSDTILEQRLEKRVYSGCPTTKKIIYMAVAIDCSYLTIYGSDSAARAQVINNWNVASQIYENHFNVYLGLILIKSFPTCGSDTFNQACSDSYVIHDRLSDFSYWRGTTQDDSAGLWHLMSNCSTYPTVGLAWLNMVCKTDEFDQQGATGTEHVSGCAVSTVTATEWMVVAHEVGHNFGASHDCTSSLCVGCTTNPCAQCCPCYPDCDCQSAYLMTPQTNFEIQLNKFSPCSQTDICNKISVFGTCLTTPGSRTAINGGICGNGVKEGTEQCDCGGEEGCAVDNCCFQNCTLKPHAVCSDRNYACCQNCSVVPKEANLLCRSVQSECDIPEYCQGNSTCPDDLYKPDGLPCSNATGVTNGGLFSNLKCATGVCTNRNLQCIAYAGGDVIGECAEYSGQCSLFCNSELNGCVKVAGYFRDGSACGDNGQCYKGSCSNPDLIGKVTEWVLTHQNPALVILIIGSIIFFICMAKCLSKLKNDKNLDIIRRARLQEDEIRRLERFERQHQEEQKLIRQQAQIKNQSGRRQSVQKTAEFKTSPSREFKQSPSREFKHSPSTKESSPISAAQSKRNTMAPIEDEDAGYKGSSRRTSVHH